MIHQVGSITSLLSPRQRLSLCGVHMTTGTSQQQQNQHPQSQHPAAEANNDVSSAGAPTRPGHPTSSPGSQPMMSLHHARGLGLGLGLGLATVTGPVVCATKALAVIPPQSAQHQQQGVGMDRPPSPTMLMGERVVALCQGAAGDGPASCFNEGKQLRVTLIAAAKSPGGGTGSGGGANPWQWQWLVELCAGAPSIGPALCFRRAQSLFRNISPSTTGTGSSSSSSFTSLGAEDSLRSLLCVGAHSDDPATCAASAPLYLSPFEKVQLCAGAPASRANEPTRCLQVAEQASRSFAQAPRRALGQFLDSLLQPSERRSRDLLIGMCAFTVSQAPVASAECLRSAPSSLPHDEAVRMCTDIAPSAAHSTSSHAMLCRTILPRDWSATDAATLCEGRGTTTTTRNNNNSSSAGSGISTLSSRRQTEAAVRCAVETSSFSASSSTSQKLRLSHSQAASLCASEGEKGTVLACYRAAIATGLSPSSPLLSPALLVGLCTAAASPAPGTCLHKLASFPYTQSLDVDVGVAAYLCRQPQALHKLDCLALRRARAVVLSREDVDRCAATPRMPTSIQVGVARLSPS